MTVAELVVELMSIEDQSLPVVWDDGENGPTCPGGLQEVECEVTSNEPAPYNKRRKEKRKFVRMTFGKTLEEFCDV